MNWWSRCNAHPNHTVENSSGSTLTGTPNDGPKPLPALVLVEARIPFLSMTLSGINYVCPTCKIYSCLTWTVTECWIMQHHCQHTISTRLSIISSLHYQKLENDQSDWHLESGHELLWHIRNVKNNSSISYSTFQYLFPCKTPQTVNGRYREGEHKMSLQNLKPIYCVPVGL